MAEVVLSLTVSVNVSSQDQDQGSVPNNVENFVQKASTESKVVVFSCPECVRACVHACVRACVRACVCVFASNLNF